MGLDCYIQITDIEGECVATDHEGWIEADDFQFGVDSRGGRTTDLEEVVFTHPIDKACPKLLNACLHDVPLEKVEIHLVESKKDDAKPYITYVLEAGELASGANESPCTVNAVELVGAGAEGGRPREQVAIGYGKLTVTYADGNVEVAYDVTKRG
jgi:type VI secretion system Hcp family effector